MKNIIACHEFFNAPTFLIHYKTAESNLPNKANCLSRYFFITFCNQNNCVAVDNDFASPSTESIRSILNVPFTQCLAHIFIFSLTCWRVLVQHANRSKKILLKGQETGNEKILSRLKQIEKNIKEKELHNIVAVTYSANMQGKQWILNRYIPS